MKSYRSPEFRRLYAQLPIEARRQAVAAYRLFMRDPFYPSLHFKEMGKRTPPLYSVRIGRSYRALGFRTEPDTIIWVWIGTHEEYNKLG